MKRFIYDDDFLLEEMDTEIDSPLSSPSKQSEPTSPSSTMLTSLSNFLSFYYIKSLNYFLYLIQKNTSKYFNNLKNYYEIIFYSVKNKKIILRHSSINLLVEFYYIFRKNLLPIIDQNLSLKNKKLLQIYIEKKKNKQ